MIARRPGKLVKLIGLGLGLLKAQDITLNGGDPIHEPLADRGTHAIDIPGNQFHASVEAPVEGSTGSNPKNASAT